MGIQVDADQLVWPPESSRDLKLVAPVAATQAQKPGPLKLLCLNGYFVREASAEQTLVEIVVVEGPRLVSVDSRSTASLVERAAPITLAPSLGILHDISDAVRALAQPGDELALR